MKVWVSRTRPGADRQARDLAAAGYHPVISPVLTIQVLDREPPDGPFHYVIFLSEHGVRCGLPALVRRRLLAGASVLAVGTGTAALLADEQVSALAPDEATSEGLLALPELAAPRGARVLVVSGEGGRGLLGETLSRRGAEVVRYDCYRRSVVTTLAPGVLDCQVLIAGSGDGLRQMARLWFDAGGRADVAVLVPSARVAALGVELGFLNLHDCGGAESDAWLKGLEQVRSAGVK